LCAIGLTQRRLGTWVSGETRNIESEMQDRLDTLGIGDETRRLEAGILEGDVTELNCDEIYVSLALLKPSETDIKCV
jgi:hypothetical protein